MLILSHKKLIVYRKSIELVTEIYRLTGSMPEDEKFGLTGQIRKSSVSVPSNIAEGASRKSEKDRKWFYQIARSSLVELDTQIILALNLGYLTSEQTENTGKMINEIFAILSKMV
ncbi:MAG: four helix bundle protein [Balneolaceae bacterium]|nr:MAG: four helix bundle protein [Balneolaceae bacterium]